MDPFKTFSKHVNANFTALQKRGELLRAPIGGRELYAAYLAAFPQGTNPLVRERTEHDCNNCKGFIRNFGAAVFIDPATLQVSTVWDGAEALDSPYREVASTLAQTIKASLGQGQATLFRVSQPKFSVEQNVALRESGTQRFDHLHGSAAPRFVTKEGAEAGTYDTAAQMLRASFEELTPDSVTTVRDLIEAGSLYRGQEHLRSVKGFQAALERFHALGSEQREVLISALALDPAVARFKNTVIGSLVVDLSGGMDLEAAVRSFESKVAPHNYQRTAQLVTQSMIDQAVAFVETRGLNLSRRMARLDDITINNVLWAGEQTRPLMKSGLASVLEGAATPKKAQTPGGAVTQISAEAFTAQVLPGSREVKLLVEPGLGGSFMTLTTSDGEMGPQLFKWNNPFAWSYAGGVTDAIQERVKAAGGKIDALLRVSLSWHNSDDLDLHLSTSHGEHIYFGTPHSTRLGGGLDVDMNAHSISVDPVENIALSRLPAGNYTFSVHNFRRRGASGQGFVLQLATGEGVVNYTFSRPLGDKVTVECLRVSVDNAGAVKVTVLDHALTEGAHTGPGGQKWGVDFGQWADVQAVMHSPNHWDGQNVGNKHTFFILRGARADEAQRGIYNEFLHSDLAPHRKVFDIVGERTKPPLQDEQLSGVGVSSTLRKTLTLRVDGRTYQVQFGGPENAQVQAG